MDGQPHSKLISVLIELHKHGNKTHRRYMAMFGFGFV